MPSSNDTLSQESSDAHFVATVRCVLSSAVSLILTLDSPTRARFSERSYLIYGFYVLYVSYSVLLYMAARWWRHTLPLSYMTTAFGGRELTLKGRLAFIKDVTRLSNPCFGVDRSIGDKSTVVVIGILLIDIPL